MLSLFMPFAPRFSRFTRLVFVVGAMLSAAVVGRAQSAAPSAADGFDPNIDGNVYAVALQADGKMIVAGQFGVMRPGVGGAASYSNHNNIARLNPDGSVDDTFDVNPNGAVRALVIQPDGKIIIGGEFTTVQPRSIAPPVSRNRIARLNADGTLDTAFDPNIGGGFTPRVFALLLQADNRIVVGGDFTSVQPNGTTKVTTRNRLARFNADGTLDTVFDPNANNLVFALAQHTDGKILVAGGFTTFQANGASAATTRNRLARLNLDGTPDASFDPNLNNRALALAVQRDGKIVVGGDFTAVQANGAGTASSRNNLLRLNTDGSLDAAYNTNASASVAAVAIQPDGRLIIGGSFNSVWGVGGTVATRRFAARFNLDGSVDLTFDAGFNNNVTAFAFQADGQIVAVGTFTGMLPLGSSTSVLRNRVARLNPDGALDTTFNPDASGRMLVSTVQPDGKILIGGSFTSVGGVLHNRMARLNADGSVDSTFKPDFNERVLAIKVQADGKILVGGIFTTVGGETRNNIARLNADGTLDTAFDPNASGIVGAIAVQGDGKILIGGQFTTLNPLKSTTPVTRFSIARLNVDGTVDTSFDPNANSTVTAIVVQSDGKILIGGQFTTLNPNNTFKTDENGISTPTSDHTTLSNRFARLNADGTVDPNFVVSSDEQISHIAVQSDGKIVIAGIFSSLVGYKATVVTNRLRIARLNADGSVDAGFDPSINAQVATLALQSDGKILIGGPFTTLTPNGAASFTVRRYAARLNTDGTLDNTFDLGLNEQNGNRVDSLAVQSDGKILIGGTFTSLQPVGTTTRVARNHFARVTSAGALDTAFQVAVGGFSGGQIKALAVQTDGKIVAAGAFADIGGTTTTNIARFNPTGTADTNFALTLTTDGAVNALLVRPPTTAAVQQGQGLAWLKADGFILPTFNPPANARISGSVNAVARQSDGSILVGGSFTTPGGATLSNLVRYSATGAIDPTFTPAPNAAVSALLVQANGKILVGGGFTTIAGVTKNYFVRLNADGTLDDTLKPGVNGNVDAIAVQSDGKIVIGGGFLSLAPNDAASATTRNYIARFNADGTLDTGFDPNLNGSVTALTIQPDGKLVVGGTFTSLTPNTPTTTTTTVATVRNHIVRLNTDGTVDTAFDPNTSDTVDAIALQTDGKIVVGGNFTLVQPNGTTSATARSRLARFNADGTLDLTFDPKPNGPVLTVTLQSDGKILVGGVFNTFQANGASVPTTRNRVARLNVDGTVDGSFNPNANDAIYSFAPLADGTIVVGGAFTSIQPNGALLVGGAFANIGGIANRNLALLTDDGSVSSSFQPLPNGAVNALLVQPDGKALVGGAFTNISGATRNRLARYNADDTLDAGFSPAVNDTVNVMALQPDGKIVIGGVFTTVGGQARSTIARLNADGTLDVTFSSSLFAGVSGLAVQPDGRILVLGSGSGVSTRLLRLNADGSQDSTFSPAVSTQINALALQTDGKIVIGGSWQLSVVAVVPAPFAPSYLARLNPNGTFDATFAPGPDGAVSALALQPDGRLLAGGAFGSVGGLIRGGLARLSATTAATQLIGASRNTLVWTRTGGGPELAGVTFEQSADEQTWTKLGQATRISGSSSWQLGGLSLPSSGLFYIRARGLLPSASGTSASTIEMVREFNLAPVAGVGPTGPAGSVIAAGFTIDRLTGLITSAPSGATGGTPAVAKVSGAATEVLSDIYLPLSGNTYDQVLLTGASATITADPGQVTRLSYLDLSNDIVQVEFSGAGALSIILDNPSGPMVAGNYNQPGVTYMKGHAGIVIAGADETTNVSIYSVGRFTAINQGLFRDGVSYDGVADLAYLTIVSANGKFGGVRTANANYFAAQGITGIRAIGVQFSGPVYVGDLSAADTATPMLLFGSAGDVRITGGDLFQANGQPVQVSGIIQLRFVDGTTSAGVLLPAQADRSRLIQNGADVTLQLVVNPTP